MNTLGFEWDDKKAASNFLKHRISFEEASTAFYDEFAREFDDPDHSGKEYRFILLGISRHLRVLVVVFCHRDNENKIRIISARKANKEESHYYFRRRSK